jgi:hypothetical protein
LGQGKCRLIKQVTSTTFNCHGKGRTNNLVYCACYYVVTSIKQTLVLKGHLFSCPVIEKVIRIELLLRGHQSYKVTFSLSQRWPLNTDLTVFTLYLNSKKEVFNMQMVWYSTNTLPEIQIVCMKKYKNILF